MALHSKLRKYILHVHMARNDAKPVKLFDYLRESTLSVILGPNINSILLKVRVFLLFVDVGPILKLWEILLKEMH